MTNHINWATLRTLSVELVQLCGLVILSLLFCQPLMAATPVGTVIDNVAKVSFTTATIPHTIIQSNTDQMTVDGYGVTDAATITAASTPNTTEFYPGDTLSYDITLHNRGDNDLTSGLLSFTIPLGSTLTLDSGTLLISAAAAPPGYVIQAYSIADLPYGESLNFTADLTLPNAIKSGSNDISIDYNANTKAIVSLVNPLFIHPRTGASLEMLHYDPTSSESLWISATQYDDGSSYVDIAPPTLPSTSTAVTDIAVPLTPASEFSHGQTLFIKVDDNDHNHDPLLADVVEIDLAIADNGEIEKIRLKENGPDTGIFTGYIELTTVGAGIVNDGTLNAAINADLTVNYTDSIDVTDTELSIVLVDPYGELFDSKSGTLLDGFTVHLIDNATGLHATVYGDDGVSIYDNPIVSGGVATDSSGAVYNFSAGSYRFPFVAAADYQLVVEPPAGTNYRWPSLKTDAELSTVPGGPFVVGLGSRGETFPIIAGPPLHLDLPVDLLTTQIYLRRSASKEQVAVGDFLQFKVNIENMTVANIINATLTDTLPKGLRYKSGTAKLDGVTIADPSFSDDGRTLTFNTGDLLALSEQEISYITEVAAVRANEVTSSSYMTGNAGAATSNHHSINTMIKEDFMVSSNILAGRVVVHNDQGEATELGLQNVRIYMEDGRYSVTDDKGRFHFENVRPGTHVVQLDIDTLPSEYQVFNFEKNTRFAGRAWSQFVDLQGGTLWRVDFHTMLKPKEKGDFTLNLSSQQLPEKNARQFQVSIHNKNVPLSNNRLVMILPKEIHFRPGSATLNNMPVAEPSYLDNILTFSLPDVQGDWKGEINFDAEIDQESAGNFTIKAMLVFDTPDAIRQRSPMLEHTLMRVTQQRSSETINYTLTENFDSLSKELSDHGKEKLDQLAEQLQGLRNIHISVKGYSDNLPVNQQKAIEFPDNLTLSGYRGLEVANYLRDKLGLTPQQIHVMAEGEDHPIASNATAQGRAKNRRAELYISADKVEAVNLFSAPQIESQPVAVKTLGSRGESATTAIQQEVIEPLVHINYDEMWLNSAKPGIEWLSPAEGELPAIPSITLAIKHDAKQTVQATLNGQAVSRRNFDGTAKTRSGIALSRWSGVDLIEGDNHFSITILDAEGVIVTQLERTTHYSSNPVSAELVKEHSTLVADGINPPIIAIRLTDKDGYPARYGSRGEYRVKAPYQAANETLFDNALLAGSPQQTLMYTVGKDGIIKLPLAATSISGNATIQLGLTEGEKSVNAFLTTPVRDWVVVGFAEGTVGYNTLSGKTEQLDDTAAEDQLYNEGKLAFFAKGQIKGKWLMTVAYDSDKPTLDEERRLFQTIDPNAYYSVYGDASQQGYDAASREKLYLKLERDTFYALFGDYNTDINGSKLGKYNRALTGLKSEYHNNGLDVVVFHSETHQAYIHDEIRGKGTTGPYQLSRRNILMNSEMITIEARDRFNSQNIISRRELQRHQDYTIDYQTGKVTFREPVTQNDPSLHHNFIVAKYESYDEQDDSSNFGARLSQQLGENSRIGITHINEGSVGGESTLSGIDIEQKLGDNTLIRAEIADTRKADNHQDISGDAYITELESRGDNWDAKAYLAETDENFGIGQTSGAENGTRKMGVEGTVRHEQVTLRGKSYQTQNLQTDATRHVTEGEAQVRAGKNNFKLGLRNARDQLGNGNTEESNQLTFGASRQMLDNALTLRVDREQAIGDAENSDFPTTTRFGADYKIGEMSSLFAEHEISQGENRKTEYSQLGIKSTPWNGAELFTGLTHNQNDDSSNTDATASLNQLWQINERWSTNFSIERSETVSHKQSAPLNPETPYAHGNDQGNNFGAISLGVTYSPNDWIWNARTEYRDSSSEDSWAFDTSLQTNPTHETSLLSTLQLFDSRSITGQHNRNHSLRFDLAYRPLKSKWMVLDKLELINEISDGSDFSYENSRVINNLNANYFITGKWQLALQHGIKYVQENIDHVAYSGVSNLYGIETRYDLTQHWDIGAQVSALHSVNNSQYDYSAGLSIGHSFVENIWISIGYNVTGFYDQDFSKGRATSQGSYLKFRVKFDQKSLKRVKEKLKK